MFNDLLKHKKVYRMDSKLMPTPAISLSTEGIVESPVQKVRKIYEWILMTYESQTFFYRGNVTSLRAIIAHHSSSPEILATELEDKIRGVYLKYFPKADVSVTIHNNSDSTYTVLMELEVVDDKENRIKLDETFTMRDSQLLMDDESLSLYNRYLKIHTHTN